MNFLHLKHVAALAISSITILCHAQDVEQVTLQFVSFPKSPSPEPVELLLAEGKTIKVNIPTNDLSEPYQVPALATWAVGKNEIGADSKKMVFKIYGQAPALSSSSQLIILVRKGATNAEGMEVFPIDNKSTHFGGGSFLFMNVSKVDVAGEVGEQKFMIKPGARTIIQPKSDDGVNVFHAMFYFRKGEEAKPFFSSKWPVNDKARSLIFFYHDPHNQRLRFHTIRNFLPA